MSKTVVVGLSGGVDSSVTAMLLQQQGYNVIGVTMSVWSNKFSKSVPRQHACFGADEKDDIEAVQILCKKLDIPFHLIDLKDAYEANIINYFRDEYLKGRTPNPCIKCNHTIKFGALIDAVRKAGIKFDHFATGHYVNTKKDPSSGRYLLKKAVDSTKDQTYFLSHLNQEQLALSMFPLGGYQKSEIKEMAKQLELGLESKKESQDFSSTGNDELLSDMAKPGDILDTNGQVLGQHKGIVHYTIGQRRGINLSSPHPLYVLEISSCQNTITVGEKQHLYKCDLVASEINWISIPKLESSMNVTAKIRYAHAAASAVITPVEDGQIKVQFKDPQMAITPGQGVVLYQDDIVVGGGTIQSVE